MPFQLRELTAANHDRFIERVVKSGAVWGLKHSSGWAVAQSNGAENRSALLFWSDRAYAARCAREDWATFVPTAIDLASFIVNWLPGMARERQLAGVNWDGELCGIESEPQALKVALEQRLGSSG
jgi:hypothetical protein